MQVAFNECIPGSVMAEDITTEFYSSIGASSEPDAAVIDCVKSSNPGKGHYAASAKDSLYVVSCPRCGDWTTLIVTRVTRGKNAVLSCPCGCRVRCATVGA